MSPRERYWREAAETCRGHASVARDATERGHYEARAQDHENWADLLALDGLTFDEPGGWSVVAALAGEG